MDESERLGLWSESSGIHQSNPCLRGRQCQSEYSQQDHSGPGHLLPSIFQKVALWFGTTAVDLFASSENHQMSRFFFQFPTPGAEGVDALRIPWPPGLLYTFPLLAIIPKVIQKLLVEEAELILIAPHWPRRPWFVDLVALSVAPHWRLPLDR